MNKKMKQQQVFVALVNKQLEPFNKTYNDVQGDELWYTKYITTPSKEVEFVNWGVEYLKTTLGLNQKQAEMEMDWFIMQWGLKSNKVVNSVSSAEEFMHVAKKNKA